MRQHRTPSGLLRDNQNQVLRSFVCTAFGRSFRSDFLLCGGKYSVAQKVESGAAVHGSFDDLQPVDLPLLSGDVRKSSLDDTRKGPPDDVAGVKNGQHGDNFLFL